MASPPHVDFPTWLVYSTSARLLLGYCLFARVLVFAAASVSSTTRGPWNIAECCEVLRRRIVAAQDSALAHLDALTFSLWGFYCLNKA